MNNTITLSQLITSLAKTANTDTNTSRRFVRAFFATIQEAVAAGETVSIKGFGTFRPNPEAAMGNTAPVIFMPDAELADKTNAPFAMFAPIELADDVNFELEMPADEKEEEQITEEVAAAEPELITLPEPETETIVSETVTIAPAEPIAPAAPQTPKIAQTPPTPKPAPVPEPRVVIPLGAADDEDEEDDEEALPPVPNKGTPWWLIAIIAVVVAGVGGYLAAELLSDELPESYKDAEIEQYDAPNPDIEEIDVNDITPAAAEAPEEKASVAEAQVAVTEPQPAAEPAAPSPAAAADKYDTVTNKRYLATMARQYYGNSGYWVFIYQANADKLKHPDRIAPGTKVRIPDKSEFAESTPAATSRKAEKLRAEIYGKYN